MATPDTQSQVGAVGVRFKSYIYRLQPRLVELLLPYRAIRLIKARLHETQQTADLLRAENHALKTELSDREYDIASLTETNQALNEKLRRPCGPTNQDRLVVAANELSANLSSVIHASEERICPIDAIPKLLLACMPKSGSTWLTSSLQQQLGLEPMQCYLEADRNEQEINPLVLFQSLGRRVLFVQQHIRFSRMLLRLCRGFSTKIIVLTRRLDDVVVSFRDHIENESPECSMFYMERDWFSNKSIDDQIDFLIDHAMPWYFNFLVGWQRAAAMYPERIIHVRYEDMLQNQESCIARITEFYGGDVVPGKEALETVNGVDTRLNVGRIGRGEEVLTPRHRAKLSSLARYYPECDFKAAGI